VAGSKGEGFYSMTIIRDSYTMAFKIGRLYIIFFSCFNKLFRIGLSLVSREGEGYNGFYIHVGNKSLGMTLYVSKKVLAI
jgi:hypothetical protein